METLSTMHQPFGIMHELVGKAQDSGTKIFKWCVWEVIENCPPDLNETITSVAISLDGAFILMREEGYREAMVGAISLYDIKGERQHSIYIGEAPEYGKATFTERLEQEIAKIKKRYPTAKYIAPCVRIVVASNF